MAKSVESVGISTAPQEVSTMKQVGEGAYILLVALFGAAIVGGLASFKFSYSETERRERERKTAETQPR